ncbi:hypothetical protein N7457_004986 [Penicillium paradoxum]|uniref:uncharacterized protein n=1 Tax=Penicillium paradoxum TaxID=176176 RepID=UPI002547C0E7|nr:uncharacterized protein N7457_004986 [Penicillium paradoxum]KAJ5783212.1 hypothetical protein N7457_004986 [Penicillium paradoxum]
MDELSFYVVAEPTYPLQRPFYGNEGGNNWHQDNWEGNNNNTNTWNQDNSHGGHKNTWNQSGWKNNPHNQNTWNQGR